MDTILSALNTMNAVKVLESMQCAVQCALVGILLCEINGKRIHWWRILLHAFVVMLTIMAPLDAYRSLMTSHPELLNTWGFDLVYGCVQYRNPVWLVACCVATVCILKLPWQHIKRQLVVIFCGYQMLAYISGLVRFGVTRIAAMFVSMYDPTNLLGRYSFIYVELTHLTATLVVAAAWWALHRYVQANQHKIKVFAEKDDGRQVSIGWIYSQILIIWVIVLCLALVDEVSGDAYTDAVLFGYTIALTLINVFAIYLDYLLKLKDAESRNHLESAKAMLETIDSFRGIRHDFNNILQTYDGYFALEDYEGLKKYHEVLRGKTIAAGDRLPLPALFVDRPALLGLITAASEYAEQLDVSFSYFHVELLSHVAMADFDLCRVLGNVLNNAIEHAAQTSARTASLSVQTQSNRRGVIMVSNATDGKINTADLFKDGYTTKPGHAGHGLAEVNKILADYYGCTIMPASMENSLVIYLGVPLSGVIRRGEHVTG